ncbi:YcfA-like protein [Bacteroidales bacterium Barb4]|nr:YcfA-like protein [Bacteroidales bacterium Barb4]
MRKKVYEIVEIIEANGWRLERQKGSHQQYKHPVKAGKVTVPYHSRNAELDHDLVSSILK